MLSFRCQPINITKSNADLISIEPTGTISSEIYIKIGSVFFKYMSSHYIIHFARLEWVDNPRSIMIRTYACHWDVQLLDLNAVKVFLVYRTNPKSC